MDVTAVSIVTGYILEVSFADGTRRRVDVEALLRGPMFEPLKNPQLFTQVRVDPDLGTIVWPNDADIAPEYLYEHGELIHHSAGQDTQSTSKYN